MRVGSWIREVLRAINRISIEFYELYLNVFFGRPHHIESIYLRYKLYDINIFVCSAVGPYVCSSVWNCIIFKEVDREPSKSTPVYSFPVFRVSEERRIRKQSTRSPQRSTIKICMWVKAPQGLVLRRNFGILNNYNQMSAVCSWIFSTRFSKWRLKSAHYQKLSSRPTFEQTRQSFVEYCAKTWKNCWFLGLLTSNLSYVLTYSRLLTISLFDLFKSGLFESCLHTGVFMCCSVFSSSPESNSKNKSSAEIDHYF